MKPKHFLKSLKKSFKLQHFTNWATIVGTIGTLFFAGYTIYLTKEIDRTDKKVNLLEKLVSKSDTTNSPLAGKCFPRVRKKLNHPNHLISVISC